MTEKQITDEIIEITKYVEAKLQSFVNLHPFMVQQTIMQGIIDREEVKNEIAKNATKCHVICYQCNDTEKDVKDLLAFMKEKLTAETIVWLMKEFQVIMKELDLSTSIPKKHRN